MGGVALTKHPFIVSEIPRIIMFTHVRIQGVGQGVRTPPPEKSQNIGFRSNSGPDPLKNYEATEPASMLGHHQHASETPFKWRFAGGPMMARL